MEECTMKKMVELNERELMSVEGGALIAASFRKCTSSMSFGGCGRRVKIRNSDTMADVVGYGSSFTKSTINEGGLTIIAKDSKFCGFGH